jgi:hypothetical protein
MTVGQVGVLKNTVHIVWGKMVFDKTNNAVCSTLWYMECACMRARTHTLHSHHTHTHTPHIHTQQNTHHTPHTHTTHTHQTHTHHTHTHQTHTHTTHTTHTHTTKHTPHTHTHTPHTQHTHTQTIYFMSFNLLCILLLLLLLEFVFTVHKHDRIRQVQHSSLPKTETIRTNHGFCKVCCLYGQKFHPNTQQNKSDRKNRWLCVPDILDRISVIYWYMFNSFVNVQPSPFPPCPIDSFLNIVMYSACDHGGLNKIPGQAVWDLCWAQWHWHSISSYIRFSCHCQYTATPYTHLCVYHRRSTVHQKDTVFNFYTHALVRFSAPVQTGPPSLLWVRRLSRG